MMTSSQDPKIKIQILAPLESGVTQASHAAVDDLLSEILIHLGKQRSDISGNSPPKKLFMVNIYSIE